MPRISVKIDPVGAVTLEGHDFSDASCKDKMKPIEDALMGAGGSVETIDKPEASIPATNQTGQNLHW